MDTKRLKRIKPRPIPLPKWRAGKKASAPAVNDEQHIVALLATLQRRTRRPVLPRKVMSPVITLMAVYAITAIGIAFLKGLGALAVSGFVVAGCIAIIPALTVSGRRVEAVRQLACYDDIRSIGPFLHTLRWPESSARAAATAALIRLLPRLSATDVGLISRAERRLMHRQLKPNRALQQEDLTYAILKALEQIGDSSAIPYVNILACTQSQQPARQRIAVAARVCQPYLVARITHKHESGSLLRPDSGKFDAISLPSLTVNVDSASSSQNESYRNTSEQSIRPKR